MTTLRSFNFDLVAHELGHQWFGNHVTCSSWHHIWINEGFASYTEYIAYEDIVSDEDAMLWLIDAQDIAKLAKVGSVYVPDDQIDDQNRIFNYRLTYQKGACIIHMIRHELNDDPLFFSILKKFQSDFAFSSASAEDFRTVLEDLSGKSFKQFFNEWYYGEGYPEMEMTWERKKGHIEIINKQSTTASDVTPIFHVLLEYKINFLGWDSIVSVRQESSIDTFRISVPERVLGVKTDPQNWLLKNVLSEKEIISEDELKELFLIYPNPADDELIVESKDNSTIFAVEVYSSNGKIIYGLKDTVHYTKINTSEYAVGLYVIKITTKNGEESSTKFIKK